MLSLKRIFSVTWRDCVQCELPAYPVSLLSSCMRSLTWHGSECSGLGQLQDRLSARKRTRTTTPVSGTCCQSRLTTASVAELDSASSWQTVGCQAASVLRYAHGSKRKKVQVWFSHLPFPYPPLYLYLLPCPSLPSFLPVILTLISKVSKRTIAISEPPHRYGNSTRQRWYSFIPEL